MSSNNQNPFANDPNPYKPSEVGVTSNVVPGIEQAVSRVKGPALSMMILAPIGSLWFLFDLVIRIINISNGDIPVMGNHPNASEFAEIGAYVGGVLDVVGLILQAVVFYGAMQMKNLQNRSLAMAASIISVIPCLTACCVLGIPFGIWGLVVLSDETVKKAFAE